MDVREVETSSEESQLAKIRRDVVAYWTALDLCDDSGGTTRDELDVLRQRVTDCLKSGTPFEIRKALRLTAEAEYRRACGDH